LITLSGTGIGDSADLTAAKEGTEAVTAPSVPEQAEIPEQAASGDHASDPCGCAANHRRAAVVKPLLEQLADGPYRRSDAKREFSGP